MSTGPQDEMPDHERVATTDSGAQVTMWRNLTPKDEGVVATYHLETDGECPVRAEVLDLLPGRWDSVGFIGVDPSFEPAESSASPGQILFRAEIPPNEDRTVKYGLRLGEPVSQTGVRMAQSSRFPLFAEVATIDADDETAADSHEAADPPLVRGHQPEVPEVLQSKEAFREAKRKLFGDSSTAETMDGDRSQTQGDGE